MAGVSIANRLDQTRARVRKACVRAGRSEEAVRILAVTKGQSLEKIRMAFDHGQRDFAENYIQEAMGKLNQLENLHADWHFIGRIQSNKIKFLAGRFAVIHSVDRLSIADGLSKQAGKTPQKIFLQYNVANEATKGGGSEDEVRELARAVRSLPSLQLEGLMVMPPLFDDVEKTRPYFKRAYMLAQELSLPELSMGTSVDFEVAIEEGATWVRVGTDIFGPREVNV